MTWTVAIETPANDEPITLEMARLQCNLAADGTQDRNLEVYIASARAMLETHLNRACLITQTVTMTATDEADLNYLPVFPIQSIDAIEHDGEDVSGEFGALVGSKYASLPLTGTWPGTIAITAVVGFGDAADVPGDMVLAMLLAISTMFDNRGDLPEDFFNSLDHLLVGHRRPAVA